MFHESSSKTSDLLSGRGVMRVEESSPVRIAQFSRPTGGFDDVSEQNGGEDAIARSRFAGDLSGNELLDGVHD
jgi:hypothetical protein